MNLGERQSHILVLEETAEETNSCRKCQVEGKARTYMGYRQNIQGFGPMLPDRWFGYFVFLASNL